MTGTMREVTISRTANYPRVVPMYVTGVPVKFLETGKNQNYAAFRSASGIVRAQMSNLGTPETSLA